MEMPEPLQGHNSSAQDCFVSNMRRRTYPNSTTATTTNNEIDALKSSTKQPATNSMGHVNRSQVANDNSGDECENFAWQNWGVKINKTTGDHVYDSEHESEYDSEHENEYSEDACEDEDTTDNMILREKNLSFKRDRLLNKDRQSKKLKSMNQGAGAFSRDADEEERRDSARASIPDNYVDSKKNAERTEEKRGRGKNKCKKLAKLKPGEKIKVMFYNNCALCTFARHIGRIVRDPTITPVRVKKWTDITETSLKHIFVAVKDKFENIDEHIEIDVYKNDIMEHARDLWNNWRGDLNRHYVKSAKNMQQAIKNYPKDFPQADWEWLVKEHFYSKEFIARSKRNSKNRSNLTILHHSGSKPYRKVIYDNGGKDNKPPSLDALFFMTHTKGGSFMDSESSGKHAQLEEQMLSDPSLSNAQLMDKCFPSKRSDHVIGYGGGMKARDLRSAAITKAELMEKLKQSEDEKRAMQEENRELREENQVTRNRLSRMERVGRTEE